MQVRLLIIRRLVGRYVLRLTPEVAYLRLNPPGLLDKCLADCTDGQTLNAITPYHLETRNLNRKSLNIANNLLFVRA